MYKSIVVPLDGSEFGEIALPLATRLAKSSGATLHLVHVHMRAVPQAYLQTFTPYAFESAPETSVVTDDEVRIEETGYLTDLAQRVIGDDGIRANYMLLDGTVAGALESAIAAVEADLIVMSTHARGAIGRLFLGGVGDYLIHHVNVPVLMVRDGDVGASEPSVTKILVPLDGSNLSHEILAYAKQIAKASGAELFLLSVVAPRTGEFSTSGQSETGDLDQIEKYLPDYLASLAREFCAEGITAHFRILVNPFPVRAILDCAKSEGIDLIALATHGRSGLKRLVFGSVADRLLKMSAVPLLVVRPTCTRGYAAAPASMQPPVNS